jgi:uncharacterized membrane protein YqgA involved in biofilm formation
MLGVIVNASSVIIGSILGLIIGHRIQEELKTQVLIPAGIVTLLVGIQMGLTSGNIIIPLLASIVGGILGHVLQIENGIIQLGNFLHRLTPAAESKHFASGFLKASVLFCAGSMTIVGSFQSGIMNDHQLIFLKSTLDGFMSLILASTLGVGVLFSALVVFLYQGALVLSSFWLQPLVQGRILEEIGATGGIMVIMIGLDLLELRKIKTANFIPALLIAPLLVKIEFALHQLVLGGKP